MRFHNAGVRPFWLDEVHTFAVISELQSFFGMLKFWWSTDQVLDPPLYYILCYPFSGNNPLASLWLMRLPAILLGIAAIPATYAVVRLLSARPVALAAALATCVNVYAIQYSQEHRPYSMLHLAALGYMFTQILVMQNFSWRRWAWLIVASFILLYTHLFGGFLLVGGYVAWALKELVKRKRFSWQPLLLTPVILSILYIPIVMYALPKVSRYSITTTEHTTGAQGLFKDYLAQKELMNYWTTTPHDLATWYQAQVSPWIALLALTLVVAGALLLAWRRPKQFAMVSLATFITVTLTYTFYEAMKYPFEPRRNIYNLPVLAYFQGIAIVAPWYLFQRKNQPDNNLRRGIGLGLSALLTGILVWLSLTNFVLYDNGGNRYPSLNPDWPSMVKLVADHGEPQDIMATASTSGNTWAYSNLVFCINRTKKPISLRKISTIPELEETIKDGRTGVWYAFGFYRPPDESVVKYLLSNAHWTCYVGGAVAYLPPTPPRKALGETLPTTVFAPYDDIYALSLERAGNRFESQIKLPPGTTDEPQITLNNSSPYRLLDLKAGPLTFDASFTTGTLDETTCTLYRKMKVGDWQRAVDFDKWEPNPSAISTPYVSGVPAIQMRYNGKIDYRFFLDEAGAYNLTLEAENDSPGPLAIRVFASNAGEIGPYNFDLANDRLSQITHKANLKKGLNLLTVYYPSFRRLQDKNPHLDGSYNEFLFTRWRLQVTSEDKR